ncbi:hypothetical protein [Marinicellulosiphila megalodicopiae]|uniref:hypothetical protein n=1 Tax=Marinicellulosiphila megalodicopiae TaxID=2724896 RepID=UPI003BAE5BF5
MNQILKQKLQQDHSHRQSQSKDLELKLRLQQELNLLQGLPKEMLPTPILNSDPTEAKTLLEKLKLELKQQGQCKQLHHPIL